MKLKRRKKNKKPTAKVNCRYCDNFWKSPSRTEGKGKHAAVYRNCRSFGEEVTGDSKTCEHFVLSRNIQCEKFSNRVEHLCCIARRNYGYADDYCTNRCPQVAIIATSYNIMGQPVPKPRKPDIGQISALQPIIPAEPMVSSPVISERAKRLAKRRKKESSGRSVVKLVRRKKLKRRRKAI